MGLLKPASPHSGWFDLCHEEYKCPLGSEWLILDSFHWVILLTGYSSGSSEQREVGRKKAWLPLTPSLLASPLPVYQKSSLPVLWRAPYPRHLDLDGSCAAKCLVSKADTCGGGGSQLLSQPSLRMESQASKQWSRHLPCRALI